jgi:hypothetical protein
LWALHALYYVAALRTLRIGFRFREFIQLPGFLFMRAVAVAEGVLLAFHRNPGHKATPAPHRD